MYDDGFKNILNIDISGVVVELMKARSDKIRPEMSYEVMDVTDMSLLADNSFDIAIDKSTIDALLCAPKSNLLVGKMLKEAQRILKPGGHYIAISYGEPENRSHLFEMPFLHWEKREFALYDPEQEKKNQE